MIEAVDVTEVGVEVETVDITEGRVMTALNVIDGPTILAARILSATIILNNDGVQLGTSEMVTLVANRVEDLPMA